MPRRITPNIGWQVVGLHNAGHKQKDIARRLHITQGAASKILARHRRYGDVKPRHSSGRPPKTNARENRLLYRLCLQNRTKSAQTLRDEFQNRTRIRLSRQTVNRRLVKRGLNARRPAKKPLLDQRARNRRLEWARERQNLRLQHWRHVLFTDESRFLLHHQDGRLRVRRTRGERFRDDCVTGVVRGGGGSVHVWGGIHYGGKTELVILENNVNAVRYANLLTTTALPYARRHFRRNFVYQHDNAPAHRARRIQDLLEQEEVEVMPWPPYSPDCNPIEHCWDQLDRAVRQRDPAPSSLQELRAALLEEWENLSQRNVNKLIDSMPRRIGAVLESRGGYTRY